MPETTITMATARAAIAWMLATLTVLGGTISLGLRHPEVALAFYAHAMLLIGAACVLSIQCSMRRLSRDLAGRIELERDVDRRLHSAR